MYADLISTELLTWNAETKTLTGEVSTVLSGGILATNMLAIKSHHTGQVKIFELMNERKDAELGITAFEFEARATPEIKMILWND